MVSAPENPSVAENSLRTSHADQTPSHLTAAATTTISTLCSACSASTSNSVPTKATTTVDTPTATPASGNGSQLLELGGDSSEDSEDEELPPPADPDAPGLKPKGVTQTVFGDLLGDLGLEYKKKEEEKVVRERASKLEFKRLDELYVNFSLEKIL